MIMTTSFRLRETFRRKRMLPGLVDMLDLDDFREAQQFRTDFQLRLLGGLQIDFELHPVSVVEEKDMAGPQFGELAGPFKGQAVLTPPGGLLALEFQRSFESFDLQRSAVDDLILNLVQLGAERVLAHDTEDDGRFRFGKSSGGPFNKLDEVEQITGFGFILAARCRGSTRRMPEKCAQGNQG